ncbi:phage tail protein [Henriciella sp.]|uniref:phage tail protein n=1 Tax=Henriciella sp. TaxID=1968823 RepID=UPI002630DAFC|nr:phage tail protein [Henriciella sp.]
MARISRWFLDITLDSSTLRWWSGTGSVSFGGNTYTGLGTRWQPPDDLKRKSSLKSEKIDLEFDSSRQSDNSDPIGALLDEKWRNRAVRLRRLAWDAGDGPDDGDVLEDERGRIRNLSDTLQAGSPAIISMEIESGALAYLERRMETRSPASQTRVFAGDKGFDLIAKLEGKTLAWRTKHKKAGTVQYELDEEYEPDPRELVLGRFAKTGSFVAAWTHQQQNKSLTRIYAIADHRINKLDKVWINGDLLINTALTHGVRTEITALRSGGPRAWITFYDGRPDQTADSFLQSVEPTWTSAHRLRGVAYVIIDHRWDSDLANSYDYRFGGEGAKLYDRRLDTTAGGSGSQRWDDPSTWAYTANAMVAADHYRSGIRIMSGSTAMWFGVGEAPDAVPYAEFEALADHCDENVTLKAGGTQKRYEVNGVLSASDDHAKNLEKIARQMAARAIDQGGRIAFRPPIERTPVITLTDGDLKRGTESVADPGGLIDDMVNTLSGRFINPANDYKKDDYPEVSISAYVDDDNGEIGDTLDLDLEISGERSQRIAKLKIEDSRRIFQLTETYTVKARVIEPGEWFVRESVIRGFPSGKTFVADEVTRFRDGSIEVVATEIDPDQLVWDEETAVDLSEPPSFPQLSLPDIDPPTITVSAVELGTSGNLTPGIQLDVTLPADLDDIIADRTEMEYGFSDGASSPGISGESFVLDFDPRRSTLIYAGFQPSRDYVFRFRGVESRGDDGKRYGDWSDFQEVTTTANATATSSGSAAAVPWTGVTGSGKPEDNATKSRVFRQSSSPSSPNVNDIWVVLSGGVPIDIRSWNGTSWIVAADLTALNIAAGFTGQGGLATEDQADWASQVTGTGKPENDATKSRVFRQSSTPSSPNVNDIWVVLSGSTPIAVRAWDGSSWITGADLTSLNVAAGFTGQDWGATASEEEAANSVVQNLIQNKLPTDFSAYPKEWTGQLGGSAIAASDATGWQLITGGLNFNCNGTLNYLMSKALIRNIVGEKYKLRVHWQFAVQPSASSSTPALSLFFRSQDSDYTYLSARAFTTFTRGTGGGPFVSEIEWTGVSGDVWLRPGLYVRSELTDGIIKMLSMEFYVPGIGWTKLSGIEDEADVTGNHDSAGFAGQGPFATGLYYEQAGDPGSVPNGSIWFKTSTNELFIRRSGSWGKVADIAPAAPPDPLRITLSSGSLSASRADAGTLTVNPVFAGAGGTGPYTFSYTPLAPFDSSQPDVTYPDLTGSGIEVTSTSGTNNVEAKWSALITMTDDDGNSVTTPFGGTFTWGLPP